MRKPSSRAGTIFAAALAAFVVGAVVVGAASAGLSPPDVPSGDVALVEGAPNGDVSQAEFESALQEQALRQGLNKVPATSDPQYATLRDSAVSDLLLTRWIRGEAADRGITVSDTQVTDSLKQLIKQQFGGQQQFQKFLRSQGFSQADARERVELQLLSNGIQNAVLPQNPPPPVSEDEVKSYYEQNITQFQQPETRDVRLVLNQDQAEVEKAKAALGANPTPDDWKKVAKRYSTDQATKDSGGLRKNVAQGQSEPTLDKEIFAAPTGQVVGPFKSESGYYLIEVEKVTPASTQALPDVSDQIKQQLVSAKQQAAASVFNTAFVQKWTSRTFCASGYVTDRCENFTPPPACTGQAEAKQDCGAFVSSTRPVEPGSNTIFGPLTPGLPQGPLQSAPSGQPGAIPLGTPGAPTPTPTPPPGSGG